MWNEKMAARAKCREIDPDALFVQGAAQNRAKLICRGCPVRTQCLAEALDSRIEFGVCGGMTERGTTSSPAPRSVTRRRGPSKSRCTASRPSPPGTDPRALGRGAPTRP